MAMPRLRANSSTRDLFVARHDPAGRIAGRGDEDRLGARVAQREHLFEIELPAGGEARQSSSSRAKRTSAPIICAAWKMLGQIGETTTTLSPVSTRICSAVTTASVAAPGIEMRSSADVGADGALVKIADRFAQRQDAARWTNKRSCRRPAPAWRRRG